MKKKWIALAALAASFALLTGCGSDTASAKSASAASAAVSAAPAKSQNKSGESAVKKSEKRIIRITAGSHVIHAKLYDNAAARALWDKMPVTYSMQNLYNREMCFRMGAGSLPTKEAKDTGYKVGDISYWPPMGSLSSFTARTAKSSNSSRSATRTTTFHSLPTWERHRLFSKNPKYNIGRNSL